MADVITLHTPSKPLAWPSCFPVQPVGAIRKTFGKRYEVVIRDRRGVTRTVRIAGLSRKGLLVLCEYDAAKLRRWFPKGNDSWDHERAQGILVKACFTLGYVPRPEGGTAGSVERLESISSAPELT
jgi:hypothetical protein